MDNILNIIILGAMPEEVGEIKKRVKNLEEFIFGDLTLFRGDWINIKNNQSIKIIFAWSGWGKVSAARTLTRAISLSENCNKIDLIIFTGVAGAINEKFNQWDIVISEKLFQYDLDPRPLFDLYEIPALRKVFLIPTQEIIDWSFKTLKEFVDSDSIKFKKVHKGTIGTADKFVSTQNLLDEIKNNLFSIDAVEMEGAAVAQVAIQEKLPWVIIRVISDSADDSATNDFSTFLNNYKLSSWHLIEALLNNLHNLKIN